MNFAESILFLLMIVLFLSSLKSNTFFIVFGAAIYLFFILQLASFDPIEILEKIAKYIVFNPLGILILFIPLMLNAFFNYLKSSLKKKKEDTS